MSWIPTALLLVPDPTPAPTVPVAMTWTNLATRQDEQLREHLTGVIASFDEHVERERQSKAIAEVMAKANAGKTKEALALLDALIPTVSDEDLHEQLVAMRKALRR